MTYAIPESLYRSAMTHRGDQPFGWKLCCPVGHTWWFVGETEQQRAERLLDDERAWAARLAAERDQLKASVRSERSAKTRARNQRDEARRQQQDGQCPCCGKTFKALAKHMTRRHPGFSTEEID